VVVGHEAPPFHTRRWKQQLAQILVRVVHETTPEKPPVYALVARRDNVQLSRPVLSVSSLRGARSDREEGASGHHGKQQRDDTVQQRFVSYAAKQWLPPKRPLINSAERVGELAARADLERRSSAPKLVLVRSEAKSE
jgi:hypothetical protein